MVELPYGETKGVLFGAVHTVKEHTTGLFYSNFLYSSARWRISYKLQAQKGAWFVSGHIGTSGSWGLTSPSMSSGFELQAHDAIGSLVQI